MSAEQLQDDVIDIKEVDTNKLREVIAQFNDLPIWKGEKRLRVAGVKSEAMRDSFISAIEGLPKDKLSELPLHIGYYYNYLVLTIVPEETAALEKLGLLTKKDNGAGEATETVTAQTEKKPEPAPENTAKAKPPKKEKTKKAEPPKKTIDTAPEKKDEPAPKPEAPKKATPPKKEKKESRADIFKRLMEEGGGTRPELAEKMLKAYGGTENEARFQTWNATRILILFGVAKMDELTGKVTLVKK